MLNENLRKQNEVNTQLQVEISNKDVEIEKLKTQIHLPTCQLETMNIEMGELNKQLNFSETRFVKTKWFFILLNILKLLKSIGGSTLFFQVDLIL